MNVEALKEYIGKNINVGIKDRYGTDKLFFYNGAIEKILEDCIVLQTKKGVVFLDASQILQVTMQNPWEV